MTHSPGFWIRCRFVLARRFVAVTVLTLISTTSILAQPLEQDSITQFVPASTNLFISLQRLPDIDQALKRTRIWRFVPLLTGRETDESTTPSVRSAIRELIGRNSRIDAEDLMRSEVGLVAPSWSQLGQAIWLIRVPEVEVLQRWFPKERLNEVDVAAGAQVFRTDSGMTVCVRGRVAALARSGGDWALLGSILRLMAGRGEDNLALSLSFRELSAYLPNRPLAVVYSADHDTAAEGAGVSSGFVEPLRRRIVIGLYSDGSRIDVALRGTSQSTGMGSAVSSRAVERMLSLPRTTLGAYLTRVDWSGLLTATGERPGGTFHRYARLLSGLSRNDTASEHEGFQLGHHVILAWDQDLRADGSAPQLALLVEAKEARYLADAGVQVADSLRGLISAVEESDVGEALAVRTQSHLGVTIHSVPMGSYALSSKFAWMKLAARLEPSWAAVGDWFILTLTRDHLERILDAQIGFSAGLGDQADARAFRENSEKNAAIALLQGQLAATVMERWLAQAESESASLLNQAVWGARDPSELFDPGRLGIEMRQDGGPGWVEVLSVEPFTPADGRLQPGDRILGVNGQLLGFAAPSDDLRQSWESAKPGTSQTFRVLRHDEMIECTVLRREDDVRLTNLLVKPIDAVRELAALCRSIPFVSVRIPASDEKYFSALITLRLADDSR